MEYYVDIMEEKKAQMSRFQYSGGLRGQRKKAKKEKSAGKAKSEVTRSRRNDSQMRQAGGSRDGMVRMDKTLSITASLPVMPFFIRQFIPTSRTLLSSPPMTNFHCSRTTTVGLPQNPSTKASTRRSRIRMY